MGRDRTPSPSSSPISTSSHINPNDFHNLTLLNDGLYDLTITLPSSTTPLCHITNTFFTTSNKPSITLSHLPSSSPPSSHSTPKVLGFVKLSYGSKDIVGLGPVDGAEPNTETVYEELRTSSWWRRDRHKFEFGGRGQGQRKTYVWIRTKARWWGDQPDLELREKLSSDGDVPHKDNFSNERAEKGDEEVKECEERGNKEHKEKGKEGLGEVLAVYEGQQGLLTKKRGVFYLRKLRPGEDNKLSRDADDGFGLGSGDGKEIYDWYLMVLLTGCALIEEGRRRARARYLGANTAS